LSSLVTGLFLLALLLKQRWSPLLRLTSFRLWSCASSLTLSWEFARPNSNKYSFTSLSFIWLQSIPSLLCSYMDRFCHAPWSLLLSGYLD
jgi:hypothetical protein